MQVLCSAASTHPEATTPDVQCPVCGEGFQLYWERTSRTERSQTLKKIHAALVDHHAAPSEDAGPHPEGAFNIPSWSGQPHFSGAAMLGGFPGLAR